MTKVIIVGAGLSGLTAAIKLAQKNIQVQIFSPSTSETSQSVMAMGGINAALDTKAEDDSIIEHYNDTLNGAKELSHTRAVKKLCQDAPDIIRWLSDIGTSFTRDPDGQVNLRYFGGQKKMRTAYAGTRTGKQIITALNTQTRRYEYEGLIQRYTGYRFLSLLLNQDKTAAGVIVLDEITNRMESFTSDYVVIATGGMNKLFGKTSGSLQNDGCTTGLLLSQEVELANLEMIQYHPTTIDTQVKRMLITEAARSEGAKLYTIRDGKKWYFMQEWYPDLAELMPRDIVSQSIYKICNEYNLGINGENKVYLDLTHLPEDTIRVKLDEVYDVCTRYLGLNPQKDPIPVYPGVHYFMGGIRTDENHKTNIENLYAIGECSSQYHGANRLGGNSLLGAIHGGWIVSENINPEERNHISQESIDQQLQKEQMKYERWRQIQKEENLTSAYEVEDKIADMMNTAMGIYRNQKQLTEAYKKLETMDSIMINSHGNYYQYIRIEALINLSKAMIKSACERRESRGAHQRTDYPECDDEKYKRTTCLQLKDDKLNVQFKQIDYQNRW